MTVFVDANVLLNVATFDPHWSDWSVRQLERLSLDGVLAINDTVYAEISVGYDAVDEVDDLIEGMKLRLLPIGRPALFLAAKAHERYRRAGGPRLGVIPDFFIGAQALVEDARLLTRDARRY